MPEHAMSATARNPEGKVDAPPVEQVPPVDAAPRQKDEELVLDELLVEDVSIDGMCGVY